MIAGAAILGENGIDARRRVATLGQGQISEPATSGIFWVPGCEKFFIGACPGVLRWYDKDVPSNLTMQLWFHSLTADRRIDFTFDIGRDDLQGGMIRYRHRYTRAQVDIGTTIVSEVWQGTNYFGFTKVVTGFGYAWRHDIYSYAAPPIGKWKGDGFFENIEDPFNPIVLGGYTGENFTEWPVFDASGDYTPDAPNLVCKVCNNIDSPCRAGMGIRTNLSSEAPSTENRRFNVAWGYQY